MKDILLQQYNLIKKESDFKTIRKSIKFSYKTDLEKFLYYYNSWKYTNSNLHTVPDIDKRSFEFQLDHIIPISLGYKYGIDPSIIGSSNNLRIIERKYNTLKNNRITDDVLNTLVSFGIDFNTIEVVDREVYNNKSISIRPDLSTENKNSLLYYLPSNKSKV